MEALENNRVQGKKKELLVLVISKPKKINCFHAITSKEPMVL
jgi:hypothetical protein